ncbi:AAA family ATPase [Luteimonas sp. e5]
MTIPQKQSPAGGPGDAVTIAGGEVDNKPSMAEAQQFLALLDPENDDWQFRTFADKGGGGGRAFAGDFHNKRVSLGIDNANGRGVFVVVNEGGQKDGEITRIRAVFADFDKPDTLPDRFDLEPHIIVQSSPGKFHAYWLVDGLEVAAFKPIQQAIAAKYGSDPSVCNPSRVMRLPGFVHHKGEPFRTRIFHESGGLPYSAQVVREAFNAARGPDSVSHPSARNGTGEVTINADRHADVLKLAGRMANEVHRGLSMEAARAAMFKEAERGRWSREVTPDEMQRALDGAVAKLRSGEWAPPTEAAEAPESAGPLLVDVPLAGLMQAPPEPPQYVVEPTVPRSVVTLLGGHGGAGKSMFALTLAAHVACGLDVYGWKVSQGRVLFVSLEDAGPMVRHRLRKIVQAHGLNADAVADGLRVVDGTEADAALMTEVNEFGRKWLAATPAMLEVEAAAAGADLVIIDNASDAFDGNENERRAVRQFVRRLAQTAKRNNAGLILLAHINKAAALTGAAGNSYSGSTAWHNSARSRLAMIPDAGDTVEVLHEKHQHGKTADPVLLAWTPQGVLEPFQRIGPADVEQAAEDADTVLGLLEIAIQAGLTVPTAVSGSHTAWHVLESLGEFPDYLRKAEGKRRTKAALVRLSRERRITRETYRSTHRKQHERWALAHPRLNES